MVGVRGLPKPDVDEKEIQVLKNLVNAASEDFGEAANRRLFDLLSKGITLGNICIGIYFAKHFPFTNAQSRITPLSLLLGRGAIVLLTYFTGETVLVHQKEQVRQHYPHPERLRYFIKTRELLTRPSPNPTRRYLEESPRTATNPIDIKKYRKQFSMWEWSIIATKDQRMGQEQWVQLLTETNKIAESTEARVAELPPDRQEFVVNGFLKNYLWPCTSQVYGVQIKDEYDWEKFMEEQLKRWGKGGIVDGRSPGAKSEKQVKWSLGAPEGRDDFWKWWQDEKTGKPIFREDP